MAFKDPGGIEKNRPAQGKGHPGTDSRGDRQEEAGSKRKRRRQARITAYAAAQGPCLIERKGTPWHDHHVGLTSGRWHGTETER